MILKGIYRNKIKSPQNYFNKIVDFSKSNIVTINKHKNLNYIINCFNPYVDLKIFLKTPKKMFSLGYKAEDLDAKPIQKNKYDYVKLSFGNEARNKLLEGINTISDNVAITYGPLGKNIVIENGENTIVTKDGVTVAKHIGLSKRHQNIGCRLISIIAGNTNEFAGDGTTTATVIAGELSK
jgi:TCP-1/cpn60 chaperonin family